MLIGRNLQNPGDVHKAGRALSAARGDQPGEGSLQKGQQPEGVQMVW